MRATPKTFKVQVGTPFHNVEEVRVAEVRELCGWCIIPLWKTWGKDMLDSILDPDGGDSDEDPWSNMMMEREGRGRIIMCRVGSENQ